MGYAPCDKQTVKNKTLRRISSDYSSRSKDHPRTEPCRILQVNGQFRPLPNEAYLRLGRTGRGQSSDPWRSGDITGESAKWQHAPRLGPPRGLVPVFPPEQVFLVALGDVDGERRAAVLLAAELQRDADGGGGGAELMRRPFSDARWGSLMIAAFFLGLVQCSEAI